ncbi:MAG: Mur ligase family protein [Bacteroidota bacterium]
MRIHLTAIGGAVMHNLALALHKQGHIVSGSDDEIFDPAKSRLEKAGLLPKEFGWDEKRITDDLDLVIIGMHARQDNPEIAKAKEKNIPLCSFPEYLYKHAAEKGRVVVAGSHGKTTITSMILQMLRSAGRRFDYMVGSELEGFDLMVGLTDEATVMVFEGDEYLSSPLDLRPKFWHYKPHIAIISGIAWDHINVFPTFDVYVDAFRKFIDSIELNGVLVYNEEDEILKKLALESRADIHKIPYHTPEYKIEDGKIFWKTNNEMIPLNVPGRHNVQNMEGAMQVCLAMGIETDDILRAATTFKGAARRLELMEKNERSIVYRDFAHAPSKLKATVSSVKEMYPDKKVVAVMELHTFSSLNQKFLDHYKDTMKDADVAIVYFNPHTIEHKKLLPVSVEQVKTAFDKNDILVLTDSQILRDTLLNMDNSNAVFLLMSSGNFDGIDFKTFSSQLIQ